MTVTVTDLVGWIQGRVVNPDALGSGGTGLKISRMSPLPVSREGDVSFFFARAYQKELMLAKPSVLVTGEEFVEPLRASGIPLWQTAAIVACADPYGAMAIVSEKFAKQQSSVSHLERRIGAAQVHPSAVIHPTAQVAEGVSIGPFCVLESQARIGAGTTLYPGCFVGPGAVVGEDCVLFPRVTLYEWTQLGNRVRIHSGSVIGADGFGYAPRKEGGRVTGHRKIYHLGRVVIGDDVEIGANVTVDRGTLGDTQIDSHAKLDNLVQVGHNSHVGEGTILCGMVGLAGSAKIGKYVYIGGQSGVGNQTVVGDGARVAGTTGVYTHVEPGAVVMGHPMREHKTHLKVQAMLNRLLEERKQSRRSPEKE